MQDLIWKVFFTSAVVLTALLLQSPAVMWALCLLVLVEVW